MNNYEDLINYNYTGSKRKSRMSLYERSAMFSSFQALNGYSSDIKETERITNNKILLSEEKEEEINNKILYLYNNNLEGTYKYFVPDNKKSGGSYKLIKGIIKKIDYINNLIIFINGYKISFEDLIDVYYN